MPGSTTFVDPQHCRDKTRTTCFPTIKQIEPVTEINKLVTKHIPYLTNCRWWRPSGQSSKLDRGAVLKRGLEALHGFVCKTVGSGPCECSQGAHE